MKKNTCRLVKIKVYNVFGQMCFWQWALQGPLGHSAAHRLRLRPHLSEPGNRITATYRLTGTLNLREWTMQESSSK